MKDLANRIVFWYNNNKRNLEFRLYRDPYKIWLSEVMLQQTQVATMLPYYLNWLKKYPDINSVILTPYENILKNWEGLGYYNRCLNFYKALKIANCMIFANPWYPLQRSTPLKPLDRSF